MRGLFRSGSSGSGSREKGAERVGRHSSGWREMLKHLQQNDSLRVLDVGPTSSSNINFLTGLGHSIYMSHLVEEAGWPEWREVGEDGSESFRSAAFLESNLQADGRNFDVVLLWDAADYLPEALLPSLIAQLSASMAPDGKLLAFFHGKPASGQTVKADDSSYVRYHLTDTENLEMQRMGSFPIQQRYNNRQIESLLADFSNFRFFLGKDNLREVIATR